MTGKYKSFSEALTPKPNSDTRIARHLAADDDEPLPRPDNEVDIRSLGQKIADGERRKIEIEKQLANLKYRVAQRTLYEDHAKDELMLRRKGIEHQALLRQLKTWREEQKNGKTKLDEWDDGRLFIKYAKQILPKERYDEIWRMVLMQRKF